MNGARIKTVSANRYSARNSPALRLSLCEELGVMSKAPAPKAIRGGSPGEPKLTCAAAGGASAPRRTTIAAANAVRIPILARLTPIPLWTPHGILEAIIPWASETGSSRVPHARCHPGEGRDPCLAEMQCGSERKETLHRKGRKGYAEGAKGV